MLNRARGRVEPEPEGSHSRSGPLFGGQLKGFSKLRSSALPVPQYRKRFRGPRRCAHTSSPRAVEFLSRERLCRSIPGENRDDIRPLGNDRHGKVAMLFHALAHGVFDGVDQFDAGDAALFTVQSRGVELNVAEAHGL